MFKKINIHETLTNVDRYVYGTGPDEKTGITVELSGVQEERSRLKAGLDTSFSKLDSFFDGRFAELFTGLEIQVADGLTESGGEAFGAQNRIILDREKMLMSIEDEDALLAERGLMSVGDRLRAVPAELHASAAIMYEAVHEVGHVLHERSGVRLPENLSQISPTDLYGKDPSRPNEAFSEGFAYIVFGKEVDSEMSALVAHAIGELEASLENRYSS